MICCERKEAQAAVEGGRSEDGATESEVKEASTRYHVTPKFLKEVNSEDIIRISHYCLHKLN